MPVRLIALCLLWLCLLTLGNSAVAAAPRIGVATMQPGEVFFERFGHDAIVVQDMATGRATSYNFGFFDPTEPDFNANFARGVMMYYLVALPLEDDLANYQAEGRGVSIQWLNLPPDQAQTLADTLARRAQPDQARYRYEYFTNNCATQVRDSLDAAMGGTLKRQFVGRSRGNTYRTESVRLASPATWMWIGFDLGLGPYADRPLSRWDEGFVPMRLATMLAEAKLPDGTPLVSRTEPVLAHRIAPEPAEDARPWWPWALAGIMVALALVLLSRRAPRAVLAIALPLWLLCGLGGLTLAYMWGITAHQAAWANRNLLLLNPLCMALLIGAIAPLRGRGAAGWWRGLVAIVAFGGLIAWVLHWFPFGFQDNRAWVALLAPIHLAMAYVFVMRKALARGS
ncbi:MAG: DUF4105 domain-containing protein [Pseudoxanthomonas sp.]